MTGKSNRSEFQARVASEAERERLEAEEVQRRQRELRRRSRDNGIAREEMLGQSQNPEDTRDDVGGSYQAPTVRKAGKLSMGDLKNELFREKTAPKPIPKPRPKLAKPFYKSAAYVQEELGKLVKSKPTRTVLRIFRRFDSDGSGQINFRELQRGCV